MIDCFAPVRIKACSLCLFLFFTTLYFHTHLSHTFFYINMISALLVAGLGLLASASPVDLSAYQIGSAQAPASPVPNFNLLAATTSAKWTDQQLLNYLLLVESTQLAFYQAGIQQFSQDNLTDCEFPIHF